LIRLCGDGAVSNEAKLGSFYTEKSTPPGLKIVGLGKTQKIVLATLSLHIVLYLS
jgi:hypothetical protein